MSSEIAPETLWRLLLSLKEMQALFFSPQKNTGSMRAGITPNEQRLLPMTTEDNAKAFKH